MKRSRKIIQLKADTINSEEDEEYTNDKDFSQLDIDLSNQDESFKIMERILANDSSRRKKKVLKLNSDYYLLDHEIQKIENQPGPLRTVLLMNKLFDQCFNVNQTFITQNIGMEVYLLKFKKNFSQYLNNQQKNRKTLYEQKYQLYVNCQEDIYQIRKAEFIHQLMRTISKKNEKKRYSAKRVRSHKKITPKSLKKDFSSSGIVKRLITIIYKMSSVIKDSEINEQIRTIQKMNIRSFISKIKQRQQMITLSQSLLSTTVDKVSKLDAKIKQIQSSIYLYQQLLNQQRSWEYTRFIEMLNFKLSN